ncbi:uncharacterized protein SOCE26_030600 [Sorangium cellulosum]|uniref:MalT-like TPR region domain-containing protein n=1 Tax=Sorangium cellulosum TaxID=56 RepID=A0A2L0EQP7_SORCE|nr:hypothetical protein [Sorangium cellulosum]AUX41638.1 uncharacterized protein SOCE26_030600 [Sorangium cellulosum]
MVWKKQISETISAVIKNLPDTAPEAVSKLLGDVRLAGLEQKQKVRAALGSVTTALNEGLNLAFEAIRSTPPNDAAGPLVVLIDNLEKLSEGQRANVERLYLDRMVALKRLEAHLVITVALYLCYAAAGASLIGLYGGNVVVLPMIEVRRRAAEGGGDNAAGLAALAHLLGRRVDFALLFEEGPAAAERIARYSGGCVRRAVTLGKLANILQARGELDEALRIQQQETLPVFERLGDIRSRLVCQANMALTRLERAAPGDREAAAELLRAARRDAERLQISEAEVIRRIQQDASLES